MSGFEIDKVIRQRRTSMLVDKGRSIDHKIIDELCELATWAPNHKRTWPWRFAHLEGDARARYGNIVADVLQATGKDTEAVEATRTKYLRTPSILIVGSAPGDKPFRALENRDAVAAGIQNLMLAATARGIATYWGSCPPVAYPAVAQMCGFEPGTNILGNLYLGWATKSPEAPERPPVQVNHLT